MLQLIRQRLANFNPPKNNKVSHKASVLIPIFEQNGQLYLLLTQRSSALRSHSGHVSFPGGKADDSDKDEVETALRESYEEIGLSYDDVTILGRLDQIISKNFLLVTPIVGLIPNDFFPTPNPSEIDSLFNVPLEFFMQETNHRSFLSKHSRSFLMHHFYYDDYDIWGLTASLILRFLEIGCEFIPEYEVYHPSIPTWIESTQNFSDEKIKQMNGSWNRN